MLLEPRLYAAGPRLYAAGTGTAGCWNWDYSRLGLALKLGFKPGRLGLALKLGFKPGQQSLALSWELILGQLGLALSRVRGCIKEELGNEL